MFFFSNFLPIIPNPHVRPNNEKAVARFVASVISASILLATPAFPIINQSYINDQLFHTSYNITT